MKVTLEKLMLKSEVSVKMTIDTFYDGPDLILSHNFDLRHVNRLSCFNEVLIIERLWKICLRRPHFISSRRQREEKEREIEDILDEMANIGPFL